MTPARSGARLEPRLVTGRLPRYRDVIALYRRAFPREERMPVWQLRLMTLCTGVDLRAWFDAETLAGMTYTIESPTMVWLLYLAVDDSVRSRGYGSSILAHVRRAAAGRVVVLEIEPLDEASPNIDQRRRRLLFYERNGFTLTGDTIHEGAQSYCVMTDAPYDARAFYRMVRRFCLGLERVRLTRG